MIRRAFFLIFPILLFLFLLAAPIAARYIHYYGITGPFFTERQKPAPFLPHDVPQRVPTPAAGDFSDEPTPGQGYVLLDQAHKNEFIPSELSYLQGRLAARGFQTLTYDGGDLAAALRPATAFIVIAPLADFSRQETQAVVDFVNRGGRLLLIGDPTRFRIDFRETDFSFQLLIEGSQIPLNTLAGRFDLTFNGDYLYNMEENEGNFRNIILRQEGFGDHPLTENVERLVFYGSHSLQVGPGAQSLLMADENTWSSATDRPGGLTVAALGGNGRVLALGDLSFLTEPYYTVFDNGRFVSQIADFLTERERAFNLYDFPFFYGDNVDLIFTGAPDLGPAAFQDLIDLQTAFRRAEKSLSLAAAPGQGRDALYLGLYNQSEEVAGILAAADVELVIDPPLVDEEEAENDIENGNNENGQEEEAEEDDEEPESRRLIRSPLGQIQMSGTALVLLHEENGQRSVVVLAASKEGLDTIVGQLIGLVNLDAGHTLAGCFVQENLALCPTGIADEPVEAELDTGGAPEPRIPDEDDEVEEPPPSDIGADIQGTISLGQTVEAVLEEGQLHGWLFSDGPARVDIIAQGSEEVDLVLELYDPDNQLLEAVDLTFTGGEERLDAYPIPDDGVYTIVVYDYFGEAGGYTLTVQEAQPAEIDAEIQGELTLDEPVSGELAGDEAHAWTYTSDGTEAVNIILLGEGDMDAVLELYDPEGFLVERVDQTLRGEEERIDNLEMEAGVYTIVVSDFFEMGGSYILTIEEASLVENGPGAPINSIFILADDDGAAQTTGFTSVAQLAAQLAGQYEVAVWSMAEDGELDLDAFDGYDLLIWDSGDYRREDSFFDDLTFLVIEFMEAGGRLLVNGLTPPLFEPFDLASLGEAVIAGDHPVLLDGFSQGQTLSLDRVYDVALIEFPDEGLDEGEFVFLVHGPDSPYPGAIVGFAIEEDNSGTKAVFLMTPFVALDDQAQTLLLNNLLVWLGD